MLAAATPAAAAATASHAAHGLVAALRQVRPEYTRPITIHSLTPDGRSWLVHAEKWWPVEEAALRNVWSARPIEPTRGVIMGRQVDFPRRTAAFGVDYKYTGQVQRSAPLGAAPDAIREVMSALCDGAEPPFGGHNALLVNWYDAKHGEYMGAHSDDEKELVSRAPVVSLSWATRGHYRRFRFTARKGVADAVAPDAWGMGAGVMKLYNGCLVVMGGACQQTHKHELMKPTKALGESEGKRINLTLRAFQTAAHLASRKRQRPVDGGTESAAAAPTLSPTLSRPEWAPEVDAAASASAPADGRADDDCSHALFAEARGLAEAEAAAAE